MRRIILFLLPLLLLCTNAYAYKGSYSLNYSQSAAFQDGQKKSDYSSLSQLYTYGFSRFLTPALSYNFNLVIGLIDSKYGSSKSNAEQVSRFASPALNFRLQNPRYELSGGFRVQENWNTRDLSDAGRHTSNAIYGRLVTNAWKRIPSFLFQYSRIHDYDHAPGGNDSVSSSYSVSSGYGYSWKDLMTSISAKYDHADSHVTGDEKRESTSDGYSVSLLANYAHGFWNNRLAISANYFSGYSWSKGETRTTGSGQIAYKHSPVQGLHAVGTLLQPGVDVLSSEPLLIDGDLTAGIGSIDIGSQQFHNIGIRKNSFSYEPVNALYIYVNVDASMDSSLNQISNWSVFSSDSNMPGTVWTAVPLLSVTIVKSDLITNTYRYEILFTSGHTASYYKAINLQRTNIPGVTNVLVTEIEAIGISGFGKGIFKSKGDSIGQSLTCGAALSFERVSLSFGYELERSEPEPDFPGAFGRFVTSLAWNKKNPGVNGSLTRSYGPNLSWRISPHLSASAAFARSESFEDSGKQELSNNFYSVGFGSMPIPTLNLNLSLSRSESFVFKTKTGTDDSVDLNAGVQIYPNIHLITDFKVEWVKDESSGKTTESKSLTGGIDVRLTRNVVSSMNFGIMWFNSDTSSQVTKVGGLVVTYSGLRFVSITGSIQATQSEGVLATTTNVGVSWIALPVVRVSSSYSHTQVESESTDSVSMTTMMNISSHLNFRLTTSYSRNNTGGESEFLGLALSGIF